jgi:HSP20 family molecular chaperone IbpA
VRHGDGKVDVYEDEHNVTLKMEVPGIAPPKKDNKDVRIENNRKHPTNTPVRKEGSARGSILDMVSPLP